MNSELTPPPIARRLDVAAINAWTRRNELVIRAYWNIRDAAARPYGRGEAMTRSTIQPGDGDPRHGTLNGYGNLRCRCQPCRDAIAAEQRARRAWYAAHPTPEHVHGTSNGYENYRCRCADCRRAHGAARRGFKSWGPLPSHLTP